MGQDCSRRQCVLAPPKATASRPYNKPNCADCHAKHDKPNNDDDTHTPEHDGGSAGAAEANTKTGMPRATTNEATDSEPPPGANNTSAEAEDTTA